MAVLFLQCGCLSSYSSGIFMGVSFFFAFFKQNIQLVHEVQDVFFGNSFQNTQLLLEVCTYLFVKTLKGVGVEALNNGISFLSAARARWREQKNSPCQGTLSLERFRIGSRR